MDTVDREIIAKLQIDGRVKLEALAQQVGYTSMGVKKRLQRLIEKGAVKISALMNPFFFKLHPAIVLLEMESAEAMEKLLARFKDCPRVVYIFKTIGGYNLIALVVAEDQNTLESISIEKCSLRSGAGIRRSEFYPIGNMYFSPFIPVRENLASRDRETPPCRVECKPCTRYLEDKCVGCPATIHYKGPL